MKKLIPGSFLILLILGIILFLFLITSAMAVNFVISAPAGGTFHKFATIMAEDLKDKGYDANLVVVGNCILGKKKWEESTNSIFMVTEASNSVPRCTVPVTTDNHALTYFTAGWVIVAHGDTLGERLGVVGYMRQTVKDLDVKFVPLLNKVIK